MFSSNILDIRIYFCLLIKQNGIFNVVPSLTAVRVSRSKFKYWDVNCFSQILLRNNCDFDRPGFDCRIQPLKVFFV